MRQDVTVGHRFTEPRHDVGVMARRASWGRGSPRRRRTTSAVSWIG